MKIGGTVFVIADANDEVKWTEGELLIFESQQEADAFLASYKWNPEFANCTVRPVVLTPKV